MAATRLFQDGDDLSDEFEVLLARLKPKLDRLFAPLGVLERFDREDLVHDAVVSLLERREEPRSREAWLLHVVRKRAIDLHRAQSRRRQLLQRHSADLTADRYLPAALGVRNLADALGARERRIVSEILLAGRDVRHVAEREGCSPNAIYLVLSRARRKLVRSLG